MVRVGDIVMYRPVEPDGWLPASVTFKHDDGRLDLVVFARPDADVRATPHGPRLPVPHGTFTVGDVTLGSEPGQWRHRD